MTRMRFKVTQANHTRARAILAGWIDSYRMNVENWAIARFQGIDPRPGPASVSALNRWIEAFLPEDLAMEVARLATQSKRRADRRRRARETATKAAPAGGERKVGNVSSEGGEAPQKEVSTNCKEDST